jgi:NADH-quinone oxidoreductase subunit A
LVGSRSDPLRLATRATRGQGAEVPQTYLPVLLGLGLALLIGGAIVLVSWAAGAKSGGRVKLSTYESGMPLLDRSHKRLSVAFFLVAIDFVVFDVEAAFLFPWALVLREGGWPLFWAVMVFFALLVVGFAYVWLKGGLDVLRRRPSEAVAGAAAQRRAA